MAHIAISTYYPFGKTAEVNAVFAKLQQNPSRLLSKSSGPYTWPTRDGIESFHVWEVPNAKVHDATIRLVAGMTQYLGIEGYRYEIRPVATAAENEEIQSAVAQLESNK
jgi:hypothetical protein